MTVLGDKLQHALTQKREDVRNFEWKEKAQFVNGEKVHRTIKMIDASPEDLQRYYDQCESMLYNDSKDHPGRYIVVLTIKDQRIKCNAELLLRWLESENNTPRYSLMTTLRSALDFNPDLNPKRTPISNLMSGLPEEFQDIPTNIVMDACLDRLGKFDKSKLTFPFILSQGIWFTSEEKKDLSERDENGDKRDKLDVVRERLNLNKNVKLYITPKGLSYSQFRAMVKLKNKKYTDLTTEQLLTLRNIMLFALEEKVSYQIKQWEERKEQILKVAAERNIEINTDW